MGITQQIICISAANFHWIIVSKVLEGIQSRLFKEAITNSWIIDKQMKNSQLKEFLTAYKYPYLQRTTDVVPGATDLDMERMILAPPNFEGQTRGIHSPKTSGLFG